MNKTRKNNLTAMTIDSRVIENKVVENFHERLLQIDIDEDIANIDSALVQTSSVLRVFGLTQYIDT